MNNNKSKIYVNIMGGIGDQIFQFSYASYLKKKLNTICYLDTYYYKNKKNYNKLIFRLKNIAKKNNIIINNKISYLGYDIISYLRFIEKFKIKKIFPNIYKLFFRLPIDHMIYEYWNSKNSKYIYKKNGYYFGYWHNFKYFKI